MRTDGQTDKKKLTDACLIPFDSNVPEHYSKFTQFEKTIKYETSAVMVFFSK